MSVVGVRPNFIKLAPLSKKLREEFVEVIVHTGQHFDFGMSDKFFQELGISKPDYFLEINSKGVIEQISLMIMKIQEVIRKEMPVMVIVYGDTNSTLAGAMAAIHNHIPVAHIESGVRNNKLDIHENVNRMMTDKISSLNFCAIQDNLDTLVKENMKKQSFFVGDLMYDLLMSNLEEIKKREYILDEYGLKRNEYALLTCHRAETTDDPERLGIVVDALIESGKKILYPVHPRTSKMLKQYHLYDRLNNSDNVILIPPLGYIDFQTLGYFSERMITDSGGAQREAYFLGKPCVVIFDESGWPIIEGIGWQVITGINKEKIVDSINNFKTPEEQPNLFGDGKAAEKIVKIIKNFNYSTWTDYTLLK